MADSTGYVQAIARLEAGEQDDDNGKIRLDSLMDRLRTKRNRQCRTWTDTTKALRMTITDKRHQSEVLEKSLLYRHLDTLQKAFKINSLPLMIDRLESISKLIGLKFTRGQSGTDVFISSDMFYVEILLESMTGIVKDVKIAHNGDPVSCPEIKEALRDGRFDECTEHIEGLSSIYQINGDKKQRTKCYHALTSLETDLNMLSKLQNTISSVANYIHKSPLGILQPRIGGQPMKMIYFVGPYNLLNEKTKSPCPLTMEAIIENKVGYSLTVGIEQSTPHKLQTIPLMTINKTHDGKSLPSFSAMSNHNSCNLSAVFVLRLQQPIPMALSIIHKIQQQTGIEFIDRSSLRPLTSLIIQDTCQGKLKEHKYEKGHFVTLPDQQHCYFMSGVNGSGDMMGAMVNKIPFTHPTNVPAVIVFLRQQVLFNTVISSCLRPSPKEDMESSLTFEVTPVSLQNFTVAFEHPFKESMAITDVDLTDITALKCKMVICDGEEPICTDEFSTKVFHRCNSLPVTLRAILRSVASQIEKEVFCPPSEPAPPPYCISRIGQERRQALIDAHQQINPTYTGVHSDLLAGGTGQSGLSHGPPAPPPYDFQRGNLSIHDQGMIDPRLQAMVIDHKMGKTDKVAKNPMLASLLDQDNGSPDPPAPPPTQSSMLSALLADHTSQNAALPPPMTPPPGVMPQPHMSPFHQAQYGGQHAPVQGKQKRQRGKRKSLSERSPMGRSPKRKASEDDFQAPSSVDTERSSTTSPFDSAPPGAGHHSASFGNPPSTTQSPDHYGHNESHVSRLANKMENIIKQESLSMPTIQKSELESILNEPDVRGDGRPLSRSSSVDLNIKSEDIKNEMRFSPQYTNNDSVFTTPPISSENMNHDVFSKEFHHAHLKSISGVKRTSLSSLSKDSSMKSSQNHDPFAFAASIINSNSEAPGLKCSDSEPSDISEKSETSSLASSKSVNLNVHVNKSNHDRIDIKMEETTKSAKSEKRKERRETKDNSRDDDRGGYDKEKPMAITLKLNAKDLTAKTILRESPHHRSESPVGEAMDLSAAWKEKKEQRGVSKLSLSDGAIDLTGADSEVDQATSKGVSGPSTSISISPRLSSSSTKKSESKEKSKSDKKRKSSKHMSSSDGMSEKKRRREEVKREQLKKHKIYDFEPDVESENYRVEKTAQSKPTTIKITTTGGKMQVQSGTKLTVKSQSRSSSTSNSLKSTKSHFSEKSASPKHRLSNNPRNYSRSKSDSAQVMSKGDNKMDTKLTKTPTIKLEPLNISGGSATVTITSAGSKTSQSVRSVQSSGRTPSNPPNRESSSSKQAKPAPIKSRKNSLSAVIDKLVSKQHTGGTGCGSGDSKDPDKPGPPAKKDKSIYDEIRRAIVREGNKPSTPTKEVASFASQSLKAGGKSGLEKSFNVKATGAPSKLNNSLPPIPKANNVAASNASGGDPKGRGESGSRTSASGRLEPKSGAGDSSGKIGSGLTSDSSGGSSKADAAAHSKVEDIKEIKEPPRLLNTGPAPPPKVIPLQKQGDNDKVDKAQLSSSKQITPSLSNKIAPASKADEGGIPSRHFLDVVTKLNGSSSSSSGPNTCSINQVSRHSATSKSDPSSDSRRISPSNQVKGNNAYESPSRIESCSSSSGQLTTAGIKAPSFRNNSELKDEAPNNAGGGGEKAGGKRGPSPPVNDTRARTESVGETKESFSSTGKSSSSSNNAKRASPPDTKSPPKPETQITHVKMIDDPASPDAVNGPDPSPPLIGHSQVSKSQTNATSNSSSNNKGSEADKENTKVTQGENDDVFKSPTPTKASSKCEEVEKRSRLSKPMLSPRSDISSPEDGLVIDCPGTPGRHNALSPAPPQRSREAASPTAPPPHQPPPPPPKSPCFLNSPLESTPIRSPVHHAMPRSPSPRKPPKSSPVPSQTARSPPLARATLGSSPASAASPCEIDDDLMNEALILKS